MLTANVSKIKKSVLPNIIVILIALSENGLTPSEWGCFFKIKK